MTVGHYNCQLLHPDFYNNIPVENLLIFQVCKYCLSVNNMSFEKFEIFFFFSFHFFLTIFFVFF